MWEKDQEGKRKTVCNCPTHSVERSKALSLPLLLFHFYSFSPPSLLYLCCVSTILVVSHFYTKHFAYYTRFVLQETKAVPILHCRQSFMDCLLLCEVLCKYLPKDSVLKTPMQTFYLDTQIVVTSLLLTKRPTLWPVTLLH